MKKFQFTIPVLALLLGAGFAFSGAVSSKSNKPLTPSWFAYNGSGPVTSPSSYTRVSGEPDCPGDLNMCAIQAQVGAGNQPVITTTLANEINTDLANHSPSADVVLQGEE